MTLGWEAIVTLTAGAVLIAIICWRDANEKMSRKTSNPLLKAFVYCIFLLLTLALYLAISYWFVPELFTQKKVDTATFTKVLGIALLTFGAGSTTYPAIGNLKVSPYRMLLDLLMSTIPDPTPVDDLGKLRKEVRQRKCHQLITGARDLRHQAIQDERWDELGDEWTELGLDYLWCELTELNTLEQEMEEPQMALHDMQQREAELQDQILEKLDTYISSFYVKNGLTRDDRQKIVDILGMPSLVLPIGDVHSRLAGHLFQNAMVGFVLGCLNGMILHFSPRFADVSPGALYLLAGLSFAGFCTLISYSERSLGGWKAVLGLGAIAGMLSSLFFSFGLSVLEGGIRQAGIGDQIARTGSFGAMFGAVIALLAFHAREVSLFSQVRWLRSRLRRMVFFGVLAGLAMLILSTVVGETVSLGPGRMLRSFLIGFVSAMGLVLTSMETSPTADRGGLARGA